MGLFIANYQVLNTKKLSRKELAERVRQVFSMQRDAALRFYADNLWLSIYPADMEEMQGVGIGHTLKTLSKAMHSPCLFVFVYDSDLTAVMLCDSDNDIEDIVYYGLEEALEELVGAPPIKWHGNRTKWKEMLAQPMDDIEWDTFWTFDFEKSPFAEEILYLFGDKIGVPGEALVCDYGMLLDEEHLSNDVVYLKQQDIDLTLFNEYRAVKDSPNGQEAMVASWFDQPGGAVQYKLPMSIKQLLDGGAC